MSRRPQILAGCLRLLACGPETTRDLALHVGAPRALVAVALHGEPGVTREGDVWTLTPQRVAQVRRESVAATAPLVTGRGGKPESPAITFLRANAGFHDYATIADKCGMSYSAVAVSVARYKTALRFSHDERQRIIVSWKGNAVVA
ncbi:MAG TPA: hypothetical protein VHX44_06695 [Planctomycetota bacterium]|jgi:hypothetical protein|nr:hypothetical protein [Planctomycetota bacterium]